MIVTPETVLQAIRDHYAAHGRMPSVVALSRSLAAPYNAVRERLYDLERAGRITRAERPAGAAGRKARSTLPRRLPLRHLSFITGINPWELRARAEHERWLKRDLRGEARFALAGLPADIFAAVISYYRERAEASA